MGQMSKMATEAGSGIALCQPGALFADAHVVFAGDPLQHAPVGKGARTVYAGAGATSAAQQVLEVAPLSGLAAAFGLNGSTIWRSCTDLFYLTQQHRADQSSASGRLLFEYVSIFSDPNATREDVARVCDALNAKAIDAATLALLHNPHVVVLRNEARSKLNVHLLLAQAHREKKRVYRWRSLDVGDRGQQLTASNKQALSTFNDTNDRRLAAYGYFWEGMEYLFSDSDAQEAGRCKNNRCHGVAIELHPDEPADDLSLPYRSVSLHVYTWVWLPGGALRNVYSLGYS